ncbi:MAG: MBL fold metallo-hydrolase [Oscillospiraceae bacterium]|nr:MBL fold metallo-hydrolase [Oscillospiraceae bacterium]
MTIQWLGHACFRITNHNFSIVIDPYNSDYINGYPPLRVNADQVLVSHEHFGHNYREGVILSGKSASESPFEVETIRVPHDFKMGNWRGYCLIHIIRSDGLKIVHMGDLGTQLSGGEISKLFGADVMMICAGSCTALPAQEAKRATDEVMPNVIIPMHYRDGNRGGHRLETVDDFKNYFESAAMFHYYDSDTIEIEKNMEPQVAVLKFIGVNEEDGEKQFKQARREPRIKKMIDGLKNVIQR